MARFRRNRIVPGEHLVVTHDGDVLHTDQVAIGVYGAQKGRIVDKDDLDGPGHTEMIRWSRERLRPPRKLKGPITGPPED